MTGIRAGKRRESSARARLRALAIVAAGSLVFLAARCGFADQTPAETDSAVRTAVTQTLAARSTAVRGHDKAAYLATDAAGPWQNGDAIRFDDMAAVPFAGWQLSLDPGSTGLLHVYKVHLSYSLSGVDPIPVASTEYLSFVEKNGAWLVSSDSDGATSGLHSDVQLWDEGQVAVVRGSRSLVMGLGGAQRLQPYADLADHGAAKASQIWGAAGWKGTVVVEVPMTEAQLEQLLNAAPGEYQGVAAATAGELGTATASAPASRVFVNPDVFATLAADSWQVVIDHELTHVATRSWTSSATPLWLSEGAADYSGYLHSDFTTARIIIELRQAVAQGYRPSALPTAADFQGSGTSVSEAYEQAWLACRLIAETYGQSKLVAFYRAVGAAPKGTADPVDHAFRTVLGTTTATFTAKWQKYVLAASQG